MTTPDDLKSPVKSVIDEFMLSEYSTIASAHFEMHNGLRQSYRFYLGIVAVPVTAAAVILKGSLGAQTQVPWSSLSALQKLHHMPPLLVLILGVTAMVGFLMYMAMINTRFNIVLYTRTVNAVRAYFSIRAKELGYEDFDQFLHLPIIKTVPRYLERRADWWSLMMVMVVDSVYASIALLYLLPVCIAVMLTIVFAAVHIVAFEMIGARRENIPIAGLRNDSK